MVIKIAAFRDITGLRLLQKYSLTYCSTHMIKRLLPEPPYIMAACPSVPMHLPRAECNLKKALPWIHIELVTA